ncbi:MAG: tetratricopeptide repeat protein [Gemmatimonadales bacterium]
MNTTIGLAAVALIVSAFPAAAQESASNDRVVKAMPSRYTAPKCGLKAGHFKVSSGGTYLKTGTEASVPENRARALTSGRKVLLEAIEQNGQAKNPAAWYYLGRIYLQQGDIVGADSAFTKAETLSPGCKEEIGQLRSTPWVPLVNAGIDFAKANKNDSALALFRQANTIYRDKPAAYLSGGVIFANGGQTDSAIVYWRQAAEIAERINAVEDRNTATRNLAAMYQRSNRHQEAIPLLEKYIAWVPTDVEVKRALASSYRATGQNDKALALEKEVGPGAAAPGQPVAAGSADAMNAAVQLYNAKKYAEASKAFEQVLATEPNNRDALYGLANSYLALKNGPKLAEVATRLAAIEPMSDEVLRMQATGQRMAKKEAQANKTAMQVLSLPIAVTIKQFAPSATGATVTGTATGREVQNAQGKPVAPVAVTLAFEFLDAKGGVLGSQEVQLPALKAGESQPVEAKAEAAGIAAWRYKRK